MNFFGFGGWRDNASKPSPETARRSAQESPVVRNETGMKSLELVHFNSQTGKFEIGREALEVLKATKGPVGVVAVAGRARQGKSYILNQILGKSGGFTVGPTHRPCTKGLWMWSVPVKRRGADGSSYSLVLLDTEGIDAYDQTGQYSTQIFSLAVLLSSLFIYNQMGGIDEASLDRLSLVTEMTKHIRVRASDGGASDESELSSFTPSFVWLLRDFYLKLEEDGRRVSPRDYLETALTPLAGSAESVKAKNKIRESIKALFPDRDCFTLVRPVNDEEELARLDSLESSKLRPEFRDGIVKLTEVVFNKARPKMLGAQVLTGPVLAGLAEAYVSAINAGAVPTIATAWQGVAEAESRRAADAAESAYVASFPPQISADEHALQTSHQKAMAEAQRVFNANAIGDEEIRSANDKKWKAACNARFEELRDKILANAELAAERLINEGTSRLQAIVRKDGASLEDLHREMMLFQQKYSSSKDISGPSKYRRLAEFMRDVYGAAQKDLADKINQKQASASAAAEQAKQAAERMKEQTLARMNVAEQTANELKSKVRTLEEHIRKLETKLQDAQTELNNQRHLVMEREMQLQQLRHTVEGRETAQTVLSQQLESVKASLQVATANKSEMEQSLAAARKENEKLRHELDQMKRLSSSQWDSERARLTAALEAVTTSRDLAEASKRDLETQLANSIKDASSLKAHLDEANAEVARLKEQNAKDTSHFYDHQQVDAVFDQDVTPISNPPLRRRNVPDASKMPVAKIKDWLMEHGYEGQVWELTKKKAKKAEWIDFMASLSQE